MVNSSILALENVRAALTGEAEKAGLTEETDIVDLCHQVRQELYKERYEGND